KETWEPVIEHLFEFQSSGATDITMAKIWSCSYANNSANQGEAARINENILLERPLGLSAYDCARAIQTLLSSGFISSSTIVAVAHSAGACIMPGAISTAYYSLHGLPYSSMILVEPTMMTPEIFAQSHLTAAELKRVTEAVKKRTVLELRSRDATRAWLQRRRPWKRWDVRTLNALVEHGLRDLPTSAYPDGAGGVTLACTRTQETARYMYEQEGVDANERLQDVCPRIPVHCIFGAKTNLVPNETQRGVCDATQGRRMASTTRIPGLVRAFIFSARAFN
ncbi:hypothetical protein DFH09DRAFT_927643, partial [Mycena vulgaris]